jgi:hypothetical protein
MGHYYWHYSTLMRKNKKTTTHIRYWRNHHKTNAVSCLWPFFSCTKLYRSMWMFSNMFSLIWKEKMMKIVWSLICIHYFGSINKINLKTNAAFFKWFPLRFLPRWGRGGRVCRSRVWRGSWRGSRGGAEGDVPAAVPALVRLVVPATQCTGIGNLGYTCWLTYNDPGRWERRARTVC